MCKYTRRVVFYCVLFLGCTITAISAKEPEKLFSDMEINHVRVKTPGLFKESSKLYLELDRLSKEEYAFPLPGAKVISPYGRKGGRSSHSGCDIKTRANDTIRCAFEGVVRMAKSYGGYGKVIVVRHASGLETIYSHNSKNFVKPGERVKAGQAIGLTGRTGRATTEHLHFETRIDGKHFNPNIIFNMTDRTLRKGTVVCTKSGSGVIVKPKK